MVAGHSLGIDEEPFRMVEFATVPEMGCGASPDVPVLPAPFEGKLGTVLTPGQVRDQVTSCLTGISTRGCVSN